MTCKHCGIEIADNVLLYYRAGSGADLTVDAAHYDATNATIVWYCSRKSKLSVVLPCVAYRWSMAT